MSLASGNVLLLSYFKVFVTNSYSPKGISAYAFLNKALLSDLSTLKALSASSRALENNYYL